MTDKTAFEQWWERSRFENSAMNGEYLEAQEIWNAAIDAAIETCKEVIQLEFDTDSGEECAKQIQKLWSE